MNIEYGQGRAAGIMDARNGRIQWFGPDTPESVEEIGATRYYSSRSGLSGAYRCHSRPYLSEVRTYRGCCPPTLVERGPLVPVDRHGRDWDLPVIRGIEIAGNAAHIWISQSFDYVEGSEVFFWETPTEVRVDPRGPAETRLVQVSSDYPVGYSERKLAWRIARVAWSAEAYPIEEWDFVGHGTGLRGFGDRRYWVDSQGFIQHEASDWATFFLCCHHHISEGADPGWIAPWGILTTDPQSVTVVSIEGCAFRLTSVGATQISGVPDWATRTLV